MYEMFVNSLKLFLKGKLFRDPSAVLRQWLIGLAATILVLALLAAVGLPHWLAILVAAGAGGALQPWLFKDLKYA